MVLDPSKYKTGNPLESNKAKDLDDNARVTDVIANDQSGENVLDRFGNERRTLKGLENEYLTAIQGIEGNPLGAWTAGVTTFNALNDYAIYNGVPYRARTTTTLPYVAQGADPTASPDNGFVQPYQQNDYGTIAAGVEVNHRRGTSAEIAAYVLADGEIIKNDDDGSLHVGDGVTQGGVKHVTNAALNNVADAVTGGEQFPRLASTSASVNQALSGQSLIRVNGDLRESNTPVTGTISTIDKNKIVTDQMTAYLYNWSARGLSKTLHLTPTGGDDVEYLKAAFERGGVIDLGAEGEYSITDEVRATITGDIKIISRGAVIKYTGAQVADDVKALIVLTGDGSQVVETEVIMDGGLTSQNDFIPVCLTVNGALMWRENSRLSNAAAGANPVNVGFYLSDSGVYYKNMIQTTASSSFGGTYGYGFVAVNVDRGLVNGGVFGTKDEPIHRHAIYISTLLDGSGNCGPFTIDSPIIEQLRYADNALTPVTGFEYCIKSISSESVTITGAIVNGGNGFILLTTRLGTTSGVCTYDNCIVRTGQRGVGVFPEGVDETGQAPWGRINGGSGNVIVLTSAFASAMRLQMISSVIDYSTYIIENTTNKVSAYNTEAVTAANPMSALFIYGTIYDFRNVFVGGNVANLDVDVKYVNPDQAQYPFVYTGPVSSKNIILRFPSGTRKYYKLAGNTGLADIRYYEEDFKRFIRNVDSTTPAWEDENGNRVSGNLANRPDYVPRLHSFWEIDQNRFVYWTGSTWWTSKLSYPEVADTATIIAISDNILGDGASVYNTTDKKPYWYDDAANQWKDAAGTVLV